MKKNHMTVISVACGAACAVCVATFLLSVQGEAETARAEVLARYGGDQVEVCVATRDIAVGERLDASAVETRLWVSDLLPEDPVRTTSEAIGKTATSSIGKGEVVTFKRFEENQDAIAVPAGKAAVSVPAKAVQAVGGAVRPGLSVDVYSSGNSTTSLLARSVLVLATSVSESSSFSASDNGWVTLAVDPERVEQVVAASNKTELYFVLPGQREDGLEEDDAAEGTEDKLDDAASNSSTAETPKEADGR